ncbi:hypothetical protein [Flagellimonas lutimaris]|uniref:hypothetical protein n=1 Tax=Flagellimonas lutimaris TaxID=475082 RepID=UPI003F5CF3BC
MKNIVITSILLATLFIVMGGMDVFQRMERISFVSKADSNILVDTIYAVKYDDCIKESDFPNGYPLHSEQMKSEDEDWYFTKVNESARKYGKSLDSTLKNLSTVDAHDFIHQTFQKAKNAITDNDISEIQKHYHCEIMRICYDSDRSLNQSSVGRL